jgi:hypothetical protein
MRHRRVLYFHFVARRETDVQEDIGWHVNRLIAVNQGLIQIENESFSLYEDEMSVARILTEGI